MRACVRGCSASLRQCVAPSSLLRSQPVELELEENSVPSAMRSATGDRGIGNSL